MTPDFEEMAQHQSYFAQSSTLPDILIQTNDLQHHHGQQSEKRIVSPSRHSDTTMQSMMDKSLQMRVTDERLAKLERMYQELSQLENHAHIM